METRQTCAAEEMGMKKPWRWMAVASSLALAGCSNEVGELREAIAPITCKVEDSDARIYQATNIEPVNALNAALYQCTLAARDPTACREVACTPLQ